MFKINLNIFTLKVFGLFFIKPIDQFQLGVIIDIGPNFYSGPSPNNNDDSFYKQIDQVSFIIFRQMIHIGQNFIQDHTYTPTLSVSKVSLLINRLINLNYICYYLE